MNNGKMASGQTRKDSLNQTNRTSMARKLPPAPVQYLHRPTPEFKRDMDAARNGFAEEFPLLCANFDVSIVPQVMVDDPQTKELVPLPHKVGNELRMEKITSLPMVRETDISRSFTASLIADTINEYYEKDEKFPVKPPSVVVSFDNLETQEGLNKFVMKGYPVDKGFIKALGTILQWYDELQVLVLEDCEMTAELVELLVTYLADSQVVVDLKLDGNPIPEQNYSSLIHASTGLQRLSLVNCEIDDIGAEKLAKELSYRPPPWKETLVSLDLRGNKIADKGLESLANALRTNRSIREIMLPMNSIRDNGAIALATAIQKFPLSSEDLRNREKESHMSYSERDKRRITAHQATMETLVPACVKKRKYDERSPSEQCLSKKRKQVVYKYDHPFVWDVRPEGLDLWCIGNFCLEHIDLGYNEISAKGAKKFVEAIEYQTTLKQGEYRDIKGISSIKLQGNPIPCNSYELNRIDELLSIHLRKKYPPKRGELKKLVVTPVVVQQTSARSKRKYPCIKSSSSSGTIRKSQTPPPFPWQPSKTPSPPPPPPPTPKISPKPSRSVATVTELADDYLSGQHHFF